MEQEPRDGFCCRSLRQSEMILFPSLCCDAISWLRALHWATAPQMVTEICTVGSSGWQQSLCWAHTPTDPHGNSHPEGSGSNSYSPRLPRGAQKLQLPQPSGACLAMGQCPADVQPLGIRYSLEKGWGRHLCLLGDKPRKAFPFACWELFIEE